MTTSRTLLWRPWVWIVCLALAGLIGCGPVYFVPGVRLGGSEARAPAHWDELEIPDEVQLRAGGGWVPRVVNIWAVETDGRLYVSGDRSSGWTTRLHRVPEAHVRIRDDVYAVRATEIEDHAERLRVQAAYREKYAEQIESFAQSAEIDPEEFGHDNFVFRLDPR